MCTCGTTVPSEVGWQGAGGQGGRQGQPRLPLFQHYFIAGSHALFFMREAWPVILLVRVYMGPK